MRVTDLAKTRLRWITENYDGAVRLSAHLDEGRVSYSFDLGDAEENDHVIEQIHVNCESMELLTEAVVDFVIDHRVECFTIDLPD